MNTIWNVAASASAWSVQKPVDTTGAIAQNKKNDLFKPQNAETTGAIAFDNGFYSSCQGGHFEAAA